MLMVFCIIDEIDSLRGYTLNPIGLLIIILAHRSLSENTESRIKLNLINISLKILSS